ncbi:DUF2934 domain-containing protein [Mesorhizobium sp. ZMM04-5]|uniref:DUF2934 domain-containing protein n=1 Tax=Mesorhizobium marinum TaxID=3228790 RepID=A0ABV3QZA6_9HYPH
MTDDRQHRIRQRAHAIWESEGRPHGHDRQHWDRATREIDAEDLGAAAKKKPSRAASPAKPKATTTKAKVVPKAPAARKPAAKPKSK